MCAGWPVSNDMDKAPVRWIYAAWWLDPMCGTETCVLQGGGRLDILPVSATSCMAEAEAFLLVADFTIKEARSRVLYSQAWPGLESVPP